MTKSRWRDGMTRMSPADFNEPSEARKAARERLAEGAGAGAAGAVRVNIPIVERHVSIAQELWAERGRQMFAEGFSRDGDDLYAAGELERAAAAYAFAASVPPEMRGWLETDRMEPRPRPLGGDWIIDMVRRLWPWGFEWWKPKEQRRDLVRAGALIIAAIERIDRAQAKQETGL